jgi:hypothetical protein
LGFLVNIILFFRRHKFRAHWSQTVLRPAYRISPFAIRGKAPPSPYKPVLAVPTLYFQALTAITRLSQSRPKSSQIRNCPKINI